MRVLLVDDDVALLEEMENLLVRREHSVTTATNGQQAWQEYTNFPNIFDVVLTDVSMPVMDGMELLTQIRAYDSEALVIIMTAQGDLEMSIEALKRGALSYLNKPLNPRELLAALDKLESVQPSRILQQESLSSFNKQIQFSIASDTNSLHCALYFLEKSFKWLWQIADMNSPQVRACLYEALSNAVLHGNLALPTTVKKDSREYKKVLEERESLPEYTNRRINIRCEFKANQFSCEIEDDGQGFDIGKLPDIEDTAALLVEGRGLQIIRYYMDEVHWNETGNRITMVKHPTSF